MQPKNYFILTQYYNISPPFPFSISVILVPIRSLLCWSPLPLELAMVLIGKSFNTNTLPILLRPKHQVLIIPSHFMQKLLISRLYKEALE